MKSEKAQRRQNESRNYTDVLLEQIRDEVKVVHEGHDSLRQEFNKRFDKVDEKLREHTVILKDHSRTLNEHSKILAEHSKILAEHSKDLGLIKKDMAITKEDIEFIKAGFKKKVDVDEFAALERRVALLERR